MNFVDFYPIDSFWEHRDSRIKLLVLFSMVILAIIEECILAQMVILLGSGCLLFTAKISIYSWLKALYSFRWLLGLSFFINLLFISEGEKIFLLPITDLALFVSFLYLLRLINLILIGVWLMKTTESMELIQGFTSLLAPLRRFIPVGAIALVLGLALQFLPLLAVEAQEITMAQRARGLNFHGGLWRKVKGLVYLVVPLFLSTLRRAAELAQAMEVRGFIPGARRSSYSALTWKTADTLVLGSMVGVWILWLCRKVLV